MSTIAASAPLVGRESELAILGEVIRRVRRGGQMAVIEGEAGIGKSRLVESALETAAAGRVTVLASRADELDLHQPFGAILDLASDVPDVGWRARVERATTLGEPGPDVEGARQFMVAEIVLETLEELCMRGAVALAIEDLHWADPGTIAVIGQLARGIAALPVVLIVSARPAASTA